MNAEGALDGEVGSVPAFHLTDLGLAERFVEQHRDRFRYVPAWKAWLHYDGRRWMRDSLKRAEQAMTNTVAGLYDEAKSEGDADRRTQIAKFAARSEGEARLRAGLVVAQSLPGIPIAPEQLDADLYALNCQNGTIDLRTGQLREHDPTDLITKMAPVRFDPSADLAEWQRFLEQALPAEEWRAFAQRMLGYACTGDPVEQVLLLIHGPPLTGKSTFVEALSATLGDYALTADFETYLARRDVGAPRNDLARLAGARLVTSVETDPDRQLAVGLVKTITGGDTITARYLHGEFFEFRPQFTLLWAVNEMPRMRGADDALWRRIARLPFEHALPEGGRDPRVKARLGDPRIAGAAILRWLVEGCQEWQRAGLRPPATVVQATQDLRHELDPLSGWLEDAGEVAPAAWTPTKALRVSYEAWCESMGERAVNGRQFSDALRRGGFAAEKRSGGRGWAGIALADNTSPGHLDTSGHQNPVIPLRESLREYPESAVLRCPGVQDGLAEVLVEPDLVAPIDNRNGHLIDEAIALGATFINHEGPRS